MAAVFVALSATVLMIPANTNTAHAERSRNEGTCSGGGSTNTDGIVGGKGGHSVPNDDGSVTISGGGGTHNEAVTGGHGEHGTCDNTGCTWVGSGFNSAP